MKVVNYPKAINKQEKTLILGGFESIHYGHEELIRAARKFGKPIAIMMIKDPTKLPGSDGKFYASLEHRLEYVATLGVEFVTVVDFTDSIMRMHGDLFIHEIMSSTRAINLVVGKDFRFGKNAKYDVKYLHDNFPGTGIVDILKVKDKKISTTLLKETVRLGDLEFLRTISNLSYQVEKNISEGKHFSFGDQVIPHPGIYSGFLRDSQLQHVIGIHVDMQGNAHIKMQDVKHFGKLTKATVIFNSMVRVITKSVDDLFTETDMNLVIDNVELLYNN